ncbi:EAL domain-containing protein [Kangiella sp. TOML190]|uniref:EAL domain-containing protein n=1 Tax=Kangiella sp. TOML190 TaxID=2931351 RepID=UPI00203C5D8E|nr:EAL domain-containing protein [Kangiella sp. TOML190]
MLYSSNIYSKTIIQEAHNHNSQTKTTGLLEALGPKLLTTFNTSVTPNLVSKSWTDWRYNKLPLWLVLTAIAIGCLFIVTLFLTFILRQQVKRKTAHLETQTKQIRQIIDLIPHFIYATNDKDEIYLMNQYAADFCGINKDDYELLPKNKLIAKYGTSQSLFAGDQLLMEQGYSNIQNELKILNAKGEMVYLNLTKVPFVSNITAKPSLVAVGVDITEAKKHAQQIEHMSHHDPMTQLPNRILLNDRLKQSLALSVRQGYSGAILLIDLDDFKTVNHTHGQQFADKLLINLAHRIQNLLKVGDTLARLSGDTFVVQLNELSLKADHAHKTAMTAATEVQEQINRVFEIDGISLFITASIGVVVYPFDGKNQVNILPRAESAMRQAKLEGKNQIVRFSQAMEKAVFQRHLINNELKSAIHNQEFELLYQPQFHESDSLPIGFEALIRWNHKKHGTIYPAEFITAAEANNLILPIGYWVIEEACRQLHVWSSSPIAKRFVSVNLSVVQISDPELIPFLKRMLEQYSIEPHLLEFEITETVLFQSVSKSLITLNELKKLGIKLSIDDFGTGYSSLSYINRLPLDKLKIDHSFIRDIESDKGSQAIVKTIINMGKDLGLKVLAEGVETQGHLDFLRSIDCNYYQGYYFSHACKADSVVNFFSK